MSYQAIYVVVDDDGLGSWRQEWTKRLLATLDTICAVIKHV